MFKLKNPDGTNNLCGKNIKRMREEMEISQRTMAKKLQLLNYDVDHHMIRRVELGERFVTDIEIRMFKEFFNVTFDELFNEKEER